MSVSDKITIKVDNEDREIFMSFGLLSHLATFVASPELVGRLFVDPEMREAVLVFLLTKRARSGKVVGDKLESSMDVEVSREDAMRLLEWASEHIMDFFVASFQTLRKVSEERAANLEALMSSETGSSD